MTPGQNGVPAPSCLLLADRHHGLLEGLQGLLGSTFEAVVTVSDEPSLREGARRLHATLAVLDLGLAPDGLGVLRRLRNDCPEQRVIVLSPHDSQVAAGAAFRAGARGYVLKSAIADDLLTAVETVLAGRCYCSPRIAFDVQVIEDGTQGDARPDEAAEPKSGRDG